MKTLSRIVLAATVVVVAAGCSKQPKTSFKDITAKRT